MKVMKQSLIKSKSGTRKSFANYIPIAESEIREIVKNLDNEFRALRTLVINFESNYDETDETQNLNLKNQIIKIHDLRNEFYTILISAKDMTNKNRAILTDEDYYITYADNFLCYARHRYNMYVQMFDHYEYYMIVASATINKINYRKEHNIPNTSE